MGIFKFKKKKRTQKVPPCPSGIYWTIAPGDTFYEISKRLGIPLKDLLAANPNADPKNLQIGSKICIPRI